MSLVNIFRTDTLSSVSSDTSDPPLPHDDIIIELLGSCEFDVRLQTINGLSTIAKRDSQWFTKFLRKGELVKQLEQLLNDERWEVQHQTLKFLFDALPTFGNNTDFCLSYLLPAIARKLGSSKLTVRRITNHLLTVYLKIQPDVISIIQKVLVSYLTNNDTEKTAQFALLNEVPNFFLVECRDKRWSILQDGLEKVLLCGDSKLTAKAKEVQDRLNEYLKSAKPKTGSYNTARQTTVGGVETRSKTDSEAKAGFVASKPKDTPSSSSKRYRFRVIPEEICNVLQQSNNPSIKIAGLEQMKIIMKNVTTDEIRKIVPHLHSYFVALSKVLEDSDHDIVSNCLEVIKLSIEKFGGYLDDHVQHITGLLSKNFGTESTLVRQLTMSICLKLMKNTNAKVVVSALCPYTEDKNPRVKEEVINILIAALLTFEVSKLNLKAVADVIVPLLIDDQRRVRLAAFELFAAIASLGNEKTGELLELVRNLEIKKQRFGLMEAVLSRTSRNVLPKIRFDGLVEYSAPFSLLSPTGDRRSVENADYNWIKKGNNVPSTSISRRLSPLPMKRNLSEDKNLAHNLFRSSSAFSNHNETVNTWQSEIIDLESVSRSTSSCLENDQPIKDDTAVVPSLDSGMGSSGSRTHSANINHSAENTVTAGTSDYTENPEAYAEAVYYKTEGYFLFEK